MALYRSSHPDLINVADNIESYAEKLTGKQALSLDHYYIYFISLPDASLTSSAVLSCLETVEDMDTLKNNILEIPYVMALGNSTKETLVQLFLQNSPYASWEHLAGKLLRKDCKLALEDIKKRIKSVKG